MTDNYLLNAALENTEAIVDPFIKNAILQNIPVINTVINLYKGARDIRDRIFVAKIIEFLNTLDKTSFETKEKIRQKMVNNVNEAETVGRTVLLTLEKSIALEKSHIVGVLFLAYVYNHLDLNNFRRVCDAVDLSFVDDLEKLLKGQSLTDETMRYLARSGITQAIGGKTWNDVGGIFYEVSSLGDILKESYDYGLEKIMQ